MRKLLFFVILIAASASMAFAQSSGQPKAEFFAGFSVNSIDTGLDESGVFVQNSNNRVTGYGFDTSVTGYFNKNLGIEGNVDGHFRNKTFNISSSASGPFTPVSTDFRSFNFMGGPHVRFTTSNSKVTPYLHALRRRLQRRPRLQINSLNLRAKQKEAAR